MKLVIGSRKWSSWSLRPWLAAKRAGAAFDVEVITLREPDTAERIAAVSPSGKVPLLIDDSVKVWDSLAICEYLADRFPQAALWPQDLAALALGRSAAAEAHSSFQSLRGECPMLLDGEVHPATLTPATMADVSRIVDLVRDLRDRFGQGGPFLLGAWSIADAFLTPYATRLRSYAVALDEHGDNGTVADYVAAVLATPEFLEWEKLAIAE